MLRRFKSDGHSLTRQAVETALRGVADMSSGRDIVTAGLVGAVQIVPEDGHVIVVLEVDAQQGKALEDVRAEAERAVSRLKNVKKATVVLTAENAGRLSAGTATAEPPAAVKSMAHADPHGMNKNPRLELPVRHMVAVASGKGGVGKSTVAANLAVALAAQGLSVGLLDADIYGPSQPRMMGLAGQKPAQQDGKIEPLIAHGVKVMSVGFMMDDEAAPLIWRGPMVQSAIYQMLRDVQWAGDGERLDILLVDMPPGTGDAQLTMAQKVPLSGAVIVSTPQDIALLDARKAIAMFEKTGVKVLGIVENMSTHVCSNCGHEEHIFGAGGARVEAEKRGVAFLGAVPLHIDIRTGGDEGVPVALRGGGQQAGGMLPDDAHGNILAGVAQAVKDSLDFT